jgi:hypothetical protein
MRPRVGQQGTLTASGHARARGRSLPRLPLQLAYIFGAVCPERGVGCRACHALCRHPGHDRPSRRNQLAVARVRTPSSCSTAPAGTPQPPWSCRTTSRSCRCHPQPRAQPGRERLAVSETELAQPPSPGGLPRHRGGLLSGLDPLPRPAGRRAVRSPPELGQGSMPRAVGIRAGPSGRPGAAGVDLERSSKAKPSARRAARPKGVEGWRGSGLAGRSTGVSSCAPRPRGGISPSGGPVPGASEVGAGQGSATGLGSSVVRGPGARSKAEGAGISARARSIGRGAPERRPSSAVSAGIGSGSPGRRGVRVVGSRSSGGRRARRSGSSGSSGAKVSWGTDRARAWGHPLVRARARDRAHGRRAVRRVWARARVQGPRGPRVQGQLGWLIRPARRPTKLTELSRSPAPRGRDVASLAARRRLSGAVSFPSGPGLRPSLCIRRPGSAR